jgi:hypothetical protein
MRVVLAAAESLEPRDDDFAFATPGELLGLPTFVCSTREKRASCGCGRAFAGLSSGKGITFGVVAELDEAAVRAELAESANGAFWPAHGAAHALFWKDLLAMADAVTDDVLGTEIRVAVENGTFTILRPGNGPTTTGARPDALNAFLRAALAAEASADGESSR